jgi:hypothetical protein
MKGVCEVMHSIFIKKNLDNQKFIVYLIIGKEATNHYFLTQYFMHFMNIHVNHIL